jgi:hypothetical protein
MPIRTELTLLLSLLFGAVGTVYLVYGKRQHDALYLVAGFLLVIYPYLFSNAVLIVVIGAVLAAVPIAHQRGVF